MSDNQVGCIAALISRIEELAIENKNLRNDVFSLYQEKELVRCEGEKLVSNVCEDKDKVIVDLGNRCSELKEEINDVSLERDQLTSQVEKLCNDKCELILKISKLESGIDLSYDTSADKCRILQNENNALECECNELNELAIVWKADCKVYEEKAATLKVDCDYIEIRCDELEGLNTDLEKKCEKLTLELDAAKKAYSLIERCNVSPQSEVELGIAYVEMEDLQKQCKVYEDRHSDLNAKCETLTLELDKMKGMSRNQTAYYELKLEMIAAQDKARKEIELLTKNLSDSQSLRKRLEADCIQYETFLSSWKDSCKQLTLELSAKKDELRLAKECNENQCNTIHSLEAVVATMECNATLSEKNIEALEKEGAYLHTLIDNATMTNEQLFLQCKELQKTILHSMKEQDATLQSKAYNVLRDENARLTTLLATSEVGKLIIENTRLTAELSDSKKQCEELAVKVLESMTPTTNEGIEVLQTTLDDSRYQCKILQNEVAALKQEYGIMF